LLAGVFCLFFTSGLLMDIASLGGNTATRLVANAILSGGLATTYVLVVRLGARWIIPLVAMHILIASQFDKVFGHAGAPLTGDALRTRMQIDVNVTTVAIILSFVLLSHLIRTQGARRARCAPRSSWRATFIGVWCRGSRRGSASSSFAACRCPPVKSAAI